MTQTSYVEATLRAYLDRLASAEPEPGGGSAAALVGALGAALVTMVANLTLGKKKYADVQDRIAELKAGSERLRQRLEELVTLDARAYAEVAAAMKLPAGDAEEKEGRKKVLQAALKGAAEVPLQVAQAAVEVARLSRPAAELGNPHAASDAGVAAILADAAAQSAALNVKINLAWIDDREFGRTIWARVEEVLSETACLRDAVLAIAYGRI